MRKLIIPLIISLLFLTACEKKQNTSYDDLSVQPYEQQAVTPGKNEIPKPETPSDAIEGTGFKYNAVPSYSGEPYCIINGNTPFIGNDKKTTEPFENYSELDSLGRCGVAFANICQELMPTKPRGEIGMIKPSGWHTVNYHDLIDGNYLYNRCHLIGFQLAGENANDKNLITGTRYLNVEGMLPFENQIADYIHSTNNHVLYRVTPVFIDNELVARGVLMEALSVEDDGCTFCIFCYNVQPGIKIRYSDGESWIAEDTSSEQNNIITSEPDGQNKYILNTNTMKIHIPTCSSVNDIKPQNKQEYEGNIDELLNQGYSRCGICKPE